MPSKFLVSILLILDIGLEDLMPFGWDKRKVSFNPSYSGYRPGSFFEEEHWNADGQRFNPSYSGYRPGRQTVDR